MREDLNELFGVPPGHTLRRGPAGAKERVKERVWAALEANRRERRRKQMRYGGLAAAAAISGLAFLGPVLNTAGPAVAVVTSRPHAPSRPAVSPQAAPAAVAVPHAAHVAGKVHAPAPKQTAPEAVAGSMEGMTIVADAPPASRAPVPRPLPPYGIELAHERVGTDGQPMNPVPPPAFYRPGLRPAHPVGKPGMPRVNGMITVTGPPATTTEPPPAPPAMNQATTTESSTPPAATTTQPADKPEPPSGPRR